MFIIKQELATILTIIFASFVALFFVFQKNNDNQMRVISPLPDFVQKVVKADTVSPSPTEQTLSEISPDGIMEVTMKTKTDGSLTKSYSLFVASKSKGNGSQLIYSASVPVDTVLLIPHNTFSPDNKYLFITEKSGDKTHYLVFNASGKPFTGGETNINITPLFEAEKPALTLNNVTGWASDTLLILQTSGPSFWSEMPSGHLIQLSTKF